MEIARTSSATVRGDWTRPALLTILAETRSDASRSRIVSSAWPALPHAPSG
jgi:hypothetical protein